MTINKQEQEQERLSKAIDALNSGTAYFSDSETEELIQVAQLVKRSGAADAVSSRLMADTVDRLSAELAARSRKRRKTWAFSGAAGIIAAAWMLFTLNANLFMTEDPNRSYVQNSGDLAQIVHIQPEQTGPAASPPQDNQALAGRQAAGEAERNTALPEEKRVAKQEAPAAPATDKKAVTDNPPKAQPAAIARANTPAAPTEKMLALAGRTVRSKTVDSATGEIRQSYATEAGDVTLVQGGKSKNTGEAAASSAPQAAAIMRSKVAEDKPAAKEEEKKPADQSKAAKSGAKINKVTVTVDGVEATLEGEQPEEELQKIAETVVKE